jgi:hypothetical protein
VSDKYAFIAAEYARDQANESTDAPTLIQMLAWLGVSKSGFYEWRDREPSATAIRREQLKEKIGALFEEYNGTYGYRRIHVELLRDGEQVGQELVRDLMRELGLVTVQPRPYRKTTVRGADEPDVADLVARDFTAERPGMKLVGSGGREESHLPAPTEPCVTVSRHTALTIQSARTPSSTSSARTVGSHAR